MESTLPNQSAEASDIKPSFRKPTNDSSGRRYRRHSPVNDADSSSSDEHSKHGQGHDQMPSREDQAKDEQRRRNDGRELDRDQYYRYGRSSSSYMNSDREDRHKYMSSHPHHGRHRRDADGEDRNYQKSSRSGREPRDAVQFDHVRQEERSRGPPRIIDKHSRGKYDDGYRSNNTKSAVGDRPRDRGTRDDRREPHGSPGKYKNDDRYLYERPKNYTRDSNITKDSSSKSTHRTGNKESEGQENILNKRRHEKEHDWDRNKYNRELEEEIQNKRGSSYQWDKNVRNDVEKNIHVNEDRNTSMKKQKSGHLENNFDTIGVEKSISKLKGVAEDEKLDLSAKQVKEINSKFTSAAISCSAEQVEAGGDLSAAKVAALKAAELVNRNIAGGGFLSTDQKKKLLWGNKKNTATEESGSRWEVPLFSDRERQEKFNKLMGVKGDMKLEHKAEDKDGSLQAEKQEQLQMDLEKQYTAGLRRRDGRTVGLGL